MRFNVWLSLTLPSNSGCRELRGIPGKGSRPLTLRAACNPMARRSPARRGKLDAVVIDCHVICREAHRVRLRGFGGREQFSFDSAPHLSSPLPTSSLLIRLSPSVPSPRHHSQFPSPPRCSLATTSAARTSPWFVSAVSSCSSSGSALTSPQALGLIRS